MHRISARLILLVYPLLLVSSQAHSYPTKPIRLVVGFAPGGGSDITARLIGKMLTESLMQPVIVDNRDGAGGIVAANLVAKAAGDGYTILMASNIAPTIALYRKLPFDAIKDFSPVSTVSYAPHFLVVSASLPVNSIKELIDLANSKPGQLNFGSGGVGSGTHLQGELLKSVAKIGIVHVPYKGTSPALIDLVAGEVHMVFCSPNTALAFIKAGKVKPIAAAGSKRISIAPEVPTLAESGFRNFVVDSPTGLIAPAGTPKEVINKLNSEIVKLTKSPAMRQIFESQGAEGAGSTPQEYAKELVQDIARWRKIVSDAEIPLQ